MPVFHKFPVFSIIDDDDIMETRLAKCDNCGATHRVTDVFRSTILTGHEDSSAIMSIEDIKSSLPSKISDLLTSYNVHLSTWEEVQFYYVTATWGCEIILAKDDIDGVVQGKRLRMVGPDEFIVVPFSSKLAL